MDTQNNKQAHSTIQTQGFISDVKVYLNKETGTLAHIAGELRIEMPANLYKSILKMPFTKKEASQPSTVEKRAVYGAITRPSVYLSKDGNYLIHRVFGAKISKHINYYKKILSDVTQESVKTA